MSAEPCLNIAGFGVAPKSHGILTSGLHLLRILSEVASCGMVLVRMRAPCVRHVAASLFVCGVVHCGHCACS